VERAVTADLDTTIRTVLEQHGRLSVPPSSLRDDDDLYERGLSSHASVNVMLGLEDAFDVEFPDSLLRRDTFRSVAGIRGALESLGVAVATG
jgi:acyl carrier protein